MAKRSTFGNIFGTIAVVGGSVVGLGNIWRFPYVAGENGGAAFILVYVLMSLLISVPIMLTEFTIGRSSQSNAFGAYRKLSKNKIWQGIGLLGVLTAYVIMSYYTVIAGWSLEFLWESTQGSFMGASAQEIGDSFSAFVADGWRPIFWAFVFIVLSGGIIVFGVTKGIEKTNKILMPLMVVILLGMVFNSMTLEGWSEGVDFLLNPDFSKITWNVALQALGQSFFSMSIGMGAMTVYGSYIKKKENMYKVAGMVAVSDVFIAVLSGLAIFPAVFTFGIATTSGPELVFLTLPNIFGQMTGGYILAIVFFLLLFFAAITSSVSLIEVIVSFLVEEFKLKRLNATGITMLLLTVVSILCAVSQMPDSTIRIMGRSMFDFNDGLTSAIMMPLGALFTVIFGGWFLNRHTFVKELSSGARNKYSILIQATYFLIKYVVPFVIVLLFITTFISTF